MVSIPRFEAQIGRISVPTMQNFQQEQNEQIYKAVASVANTASNIAEKLYSEQKMYEAQVQGAEDVKKAKESGEEYNLSGLPTPYTQAQKAYNESAINSFAAQYTVDTSLALTNLEDENRDNPYEFLTKAQAYIDGASKDIPEYLKPSIVKPLEMNARSIYSSLLKHKIESNRKSSQASIMLNLDEMIRDALNTEDSAVQDEKIGQIVTIATNAAISTDISPDYAQKKIAEVRMGVASQRLTNQLLAGQNDPKKINAIINMAMSGNTKIMAFDTLSPQERADAIKTALGHISYAKGYLGQIAEQAGKYVINEAQLKMYNDLAPKTELTPDVMKEISWGNKSFYNMMSDAQTGGRLFSVQPVIQDITEGIANGTVDENDIVKAFDGGYITGEDAIYSLNDLFSPLSKNKKKNSFINFKSNIDKQLFDRLNNIGMLSQKNMKKEYIEDNMDNFLSVGERTDEEISNYADIIEDKANKKFSKENEYKSIHTPEWFMENTGYNISAIGDAVAKATVNGVIDNKKLREILMEMTGNNQHLANSIYSMYKAVRNQ